MVEKNKAIPASFRDPSGFLFVRDGDLLRQINAVYKEDYDHLMNSGLYAQLVQKKLMVAHEELPSGTEAYKIIKPQIIPFISYPYEWCFSQLKDAALLTLQVQECALRFGMTLKDASAYNVQFFQGRPIFIDTLSFERYQKGSPWNAYRQFCEHFLAPLAIMSATDVRLNQLLRIFMDGVPLDLASKLLPVRFKLRPAIFMHIVLHARSQAKFADASTKPQESSSRFMAIDTMKALAGALKSAIIRLTWRPSGTEWAEYYDETNYSDAAFSQKAQLIGKFLDGAQPKTVWDVAGNTGIFGRIASSRGISTVSFDYDPAAIEKNYRTVRDKKETAILPLVIDLMNPSGALGWRNRERSALTQRGPTDMAFALALIHHLAISNNLPFSAIADFFADICKSLVIEFVPKSDSNTQRLLQTRKDIFPEYTQEHFEEAFGVRFIIKESKTISGSERVLYYMEKDNS